MVIDSKLKFSLHIKRLSRRCFYHFRQLRSIRRSLNTAATKTFVSAFITSCVDYWNSMFNGTGAVFIFVQSSPFSTPPHISLLRSGSTTRLQQQFEMSCTGYRCNKNLITNFPISSTSVIIRVHRHTYHPCVSMLVRLRVIVIFAQQPVVTWLFCAQPIKCMNHAVLLCPVHLFGAHFY